MVLGVTRRHITMILVCLCQQETMVLGVIRRHITILLYVTKRQWF